MMGRGGQCTEAIGLFTEHDPDQPARRSTTAGRRAAMWLQAASWCRKNRGDSDMDWTEDQVSMLARLWQEGLSASHVARQLGGISRNAVIGKIHRLGIALRTTPVRFRARTSPDRARPPGRCGGPCFNGRSGAPRSPAPVDPGWAPTATLWTLTPASCRWPIGDPRHDDFGFCGRLRAGAGSYCPGHAELAFRNFGASRQRSDRQLERFLGGQWRSSSANWR